jgi:hypothetical protein
VAEVAGRILELVIAADPDYFKPRR